MFSIIIQWVICMAKNNNFELILSIVITVVNILGLVFLLTTPFLSRFDAIDDYTWIFYNGDSKTRFGDLIVKGHDSDFPNAVPVLTLIGIIVVLIGCIYMTTLAISKKNCFISNRKAPGPISGALFIFGGLIGFIGMMVCLPYATDVIDSPFDYSIGFGFVISLIIFILMLLYGIYLVVLTLLNKDKKRKPRKKKK